MPKNLSINDLNTIPLEHFIFMVEHFGFDNLCELHGVSVDSEQYQLLLKHTHHSVKSNIALQVLSNIIAQKTDRADATAQSLLRKQLHSPLLTIFLKGEAPLEYCKKFAPLSSVIQADYELSVLNKRNHNVTEQLLYPVMHERKFSDELLAQFPSTLSLCAGYYYPEGKVMSQYIETIMSRDYFIEDDAVKRSIIQKILAGAPGRIRKTRKHYQKWRLIFS